jgi:hypothetical protein
MPRSLQLAIAGAVLGTFAGWLIAPANGSGRDLAGLWPAIGGGLFAIAGAIVGIGADIAGAIRCRS